MFLLKKHLRIDGDTFLDFLGKNLRWTRIRLTPLKLRNATKSNSEFLEDVRARDVSPLSNTGTENRPLRQVSTTGSKELHGRLF